MRGSIKSVVAMASAGIVCFGFAGSGRAQQEDFSNWPEGASPKEIGKRVAENFVARKLEFETNPRRQYVIYPEVCTWYGSLTVAQLTKDEDLKTRLIQKFEPLQTTKTVRISPDAHVDYRVFGVVPLEIYMQTKNQKYLELGKSFADKQWEKTTEDGITTEARYWIDDMYMIPAVQVQAYRATGDAKYIDRAALTMTAYLDKLQQPNGLFFHGTDAQFYWSRGDGWMAAGMAELLRSIPKDHPKRARIMDGYKKMMKALLKFQGEDGLWRQLIDHPEAWPETSGSGMFTFAMVTGVKNGWLDAKIYGPAARKAWLGLVKYIDKDANVGEVSTGTNKWTANQGDAVQYYLNRPRRVGDLHGQAPILWSASALLR
jgi:unsaturated rhamnogalacturonyl hydrolase